MEGYLNGKRYNFDINRPWAKGGEADIFQLPGGKDIAKIFKKPNHPDYANNPHEQKGAEERIKEHQRKLPAFPTGLPDKVIVPKDLITDKEGKHILGYTMPF